MQNAWTCLLPIGVLLASSLLIVSSSTSCSSDPSITPTTDSGASGSSGSSGGDASDATSEAGAPQWRTVIDNLDGALLSIWGTSAKDVWAVGGPLGSEGFEALALHFDGARWRRLSPGKTDSYWWVHGTGPSDVWLVGEKGRITHWDGAAFTEFTSGTNATLFGLWAAAPNDAWAVGGTPDQPSATNDVVLHWDGSSWKPETLPELKKVALFKVWGSSKDDIYIVGEAGVIWHRTGSTGGTGGTWKREADGLAKSRLTTVAGCGANEVYAVGSRDVLVSNGTEWTRAPIDPLKLVNDVNGVSCNPQGSPSTERVVVVGGGSLKLRLVDGKWESDFGSSPFTDLHGAWADPSGAFWGVGGQFTAAPRPNTKRNGVIGRYAADTVPNTITP